MLFLHAGREATCEGKVVPNSWRDGLVSGDYGRSKDRTHELRREFEEVESSCRRGSFHLYSSVEFRSFGVALVPMLELIGV
jgi:hypothetical protein